MYRDARDAHSRALARHALIAQMRRIIVHLAGSELS
jgi:hypothetical protein